MVVSAWISLIVSIVLLGVKFAGYWVTGSSAVLSDALESIVNVMTAFVALGVLRFASQPADREHPYGHGKAEYVSASFEGGLIVFAAVMIFAESIRALTSEIRLQRLDEGFFLLAIAAGINFALSLHLRSVGRKNSSEALLASAVHIMSDVKTTLGVGVGLLLVHFTGWLWLDPVFAMIVAANLAWEGGRIVRRSFAGLLDEIDLENLEQLVKILERCRQPGLIEIHNLRAIRSGRFHHIDAHIVVPEYWDVAQAHELTHQYEKQVVAEYPFEAEIAFHLDPCLRKYCPNCDVPECPIRRLPFEKLKSFTLSRAISSASV